VIPLEVGDVARFASAEKLSAYAGPTPRLRPDVNHYLKWAFIEAATAICATRRRVPQRHVSFTRIPSCRRRE
jgi:hypothetical protein